MFLIYTYVSITRGSVELRGSCENLHEGQIAVKIDIVEIDGLKRGSHSITCPPIYISNGSHAIGIRLGHNWLSKIQTLNLQFSSNHRYILSATFNSNTKKFYSHFWDETDYPSKLLSSFEYEGFLDERGNENFAQDPC